jgi:hypothetical protein
VAIDTKSQDHLRYIATLSKINIAFGLEKNGTQFVFFLFPNDIVLGELADIVKFIKRCVPTSKIVVVYNPAKAHFDQFNKGLKKVLDAMNGVYITMPELWGSTVQDYDTVKASLQKVNRNAGLSLREYVNQRNTHPTAWTHATLANDLLEKMAEQYADIAHILLPDSEWHKATAWVAARTAQRAQTVGSSTAGQSGSGTTGADDDFNPFDI